MAKISTTRERSFEPLMTDAPEHPLVILLFSSSKAVPEFNLQTLNMLARRPICHYEVPVPILVHVRGKLETCLLIFLSQIIYVRKKFLPTGGFYSMFRQTVENSKQDAR